MTSKELLYIEDALGHEQFIIKNCSNINLQDEKLMNYIEELKEEHCNLYKKFLNLL